MTWHDEGRCSDCASARLARVAAAERRVIRLAEGWGAAVASEERRIYLMELESAVADLLAAGDAAGLASLLEEVENELENEATENGWRAAILDGSWPQAKDLLTMALAKLEAASPTATPAPDPRDARIRELEREVKDHAAWAKAFAEDPANGAIVDAQRRLKSALDEVARLERIIVNWFCAPRGTAADTLTAEALRVIRSRA